MTQYLTRKAIDTVFDDKIAHLREELSKEVWDKEQIKQTAESIKGIKICDPSCGSGSFLIQAIRVVWSKYKELEILVRQLDKIYSEGKSILDEYFTDKAVMIRYLGILFRVHDKRERIGTIILRHIYGNDKDVKAVDTAKLNIWLECIRLEPNSYRKDALKGKRRVLPNLELNITDGDSLVGLKIDDAEKVLSNFKESLTPIFKMRDIYTESFDKTNMLQDAVKIRNGLQRFLDKTLSEELGEVLGSEILQLLKPTHWSLQHFDAFYTEEGILKSAEERGFDVIVGNPPWDVLKPQEDEFFGAIYVERNDVKATKFILLTKDKKKEFVEEYLNDPHIRQKWDQYRKDIRIQGEYFQKQHTFEHQGGGEFNLYKLFSEQYFRLLKKEGILAVVLPAGFYSDLRAKELRRLFFDNATIISLYGFDNQLGIFDDIHRQFKFMMLLLKKSDLTRIFHATFYVREVNRISTLDQESPKYDLELIKITSPRSASLIECKNETEVVLVRKLFKHPLLYENPRIKFTNEFHMTKHAPLFNREQKGRVLFEAKMIHQFTHLYLAPRYWIEEAKAIQNLESREEKRIRKEIRRTGKDMHKMYPPKVELDYRHYRLAWRDISRSTDQRTMICTILPPNVFLGNTLNYLRPIYFDGKNYSKAISVKEMVFLCGLLNSYVVDFVARLKVSIHPNIFYVEELPIPRFDPSNKYFQEIIQRVGKLVCTTPDFDDLKRDWGQGFRNRFTEATDINRTDQCLCSKSL